MSTAIIEPPTPQARGLTPQQQAVYLLIRQTIHEQGFSPTFQEIADEIGVSKITASEHVHNLARKGWVTIAKHKARSIALVECCPHCRQPIVGGAKA